MLDRADVEDVEGKADAGVLEVRVKTGVLADVASLLS